MHEANLGGFNRMEADIARDTSEVGEVGELRAVVSATRTSVIAPSE
jgi:hypothetical protein